MREIKFRGKVTTTGEWVYGGIVHQTDCYGTPVDKWLIVDGTQTLDYDTGPTALVIPETVGQYTGLKDKNGVEIYEGDIVRVESPIGLIEEPVEYHAPEYTPFDFCSWRRSDMEIIGNIHEEGKA